MSESNTPSSFSSFPVSLHRKATFFGRSNWISVTWSCQCCAMQLSRQRQRWIQCGSASSSWCSHAYFLRICCRWHCMLTMQITLHTNTGAHSGTCSGFTHTHIHLYVCMYVRIWTRSAVTIWPCVWVMQWDRQAAEAARQEGRQGGRQRGPKTQPMLVHVRPKLS